MVEMCYGCGKKNLTPRERHSFDGSYVQTDFFLACNDCGFEFFVRGSICWAPQKIPKNIETGEEFLEELRKSGVL